MQPFLLNGYLTSLWTSYLPIRIFDLQDGHLIYILEMNSIVRTFDFSMDMVFIYWDISLAKGTFGFPIDI